MTYAEIRRRADQVRAVPLEAVLRAAGAERDAQDRARWRTSQGVVSVTGPKFMNWTRGVGGGGAIDLAIHLGGMGFKDAVAWLWLHFPGLPGAEHAPAPRCAGLRLPRKDPARLARVERYLAQDRRIPTSLTAPLINSGKIYADTRGNAVFLLLGKRSMLPVGAELRGTCAARPWRGMAPGSRKDRGYFSVGDAQHGPVVLCESAIDALSCLALHPGRLCISTAGARANPRWLSNLLAQGFEVFCGFDTDATGENMARAMAVLYPCVKRLRPSQHDWNDVLRTAQT